MQITQSGSELTISGLGRAYSTTQCWEQFPGYRRVSHSVGRRSWKNVCKTSAQDPRQAKIVTTISATEDTLSFDETGQYQFVIKGQNCTASARRTRSFSRLKSIPASSTASESPASRPTRLTPEAKAEPKKPTGCQKPGPPARLEVRPASKLMRPGESFQLRAKVLDARGCSLNTRPHFRLVEDNPGASVDPSGLVQVQAQAEPTAFQVSAEVAGKAVVIAVEVTSEARYQALLEKRGLNRLGESEKAAVATIQGGSLGARSVLAEDHAGQRRRRFIAVLGAVALLLGIAGLVLIQRRRSRGRSSRASEGSKSEAEGYQAAGSKGRFCPTCRTEYPEEQDFCPKDGNRLVHPNSDDSAHGLSGGICPVCQKGFDPGVSECPEHGEALVPAVAHQVGNGPSGKICPVCGTQYSGKSQFCGKDGACLVPVN